MKTFKLRFDKNAMVLFDTRNGTKMRFAIGNYTKAKRPELVDIKLTDRCYFNCSFCYQNSTATGSHAKMEDIEFAINEFKKAGVLEVAAGGGEFTDHPDFIEILKKFRDAGIVPNFTTKSTAAVRKNWDSIKDLIGGFAYSAENAGQVKSAAKMLRNIPKEKVGLHYVMGLGDREHFSDYMKAASEAGYRVTLLGYKIKGRGKNIIPFPYDWWIDEVNKLIKIGKCPNLSIDTPLAEQYEDKLPVEEYMFHTQEGKFSMYLDCVSMKMGASSFNENDELIPFDKNWVKNYKKF